MNKESCTSAPIVLENNQELLTGNKAANQFVDNFERVSDLNIPTERKREVHAAQKQYRDMKPDDDVMTENFTEKELEEAIKCLKKEKSPGPDGITNEILQHMGKSAKNILLKIFNASWVNSSVPQSWRDATMIPIHKKGKDKSKPDSYRPISLTSCVGKLMERMINTRLTWYLEKKQLISPTQAGFRQNRSTEDQVTYIAQEIEDAFQDKKHTLAVWIDLEKAFDKVWREGLKLKMHQCGISGHMYKWICQYLTNRKARVQNQRHKSRKKTLKQGVPQGGVLSPTLFIIFINDILKDIPRWIHGAIYADDLVIWYSDEYITTANIRMQEALVSIEKWTKLNPKKTTYTIFSLANKELKANLLIDGNKLPLDEEPTYLGITFDRRMTWKAQIDKSTRRGKIRLGLMKKLSGSSWGADYNIQRKLYVSYIRPVLEYGMTSWGTAAKTNFNKTSKVQNQASRIITGAIKSTPIQALNTTTGLQPLEDRRDIKTLIQASKFRRMKEHPMHKRMTDPTKSRIKRKSFLHQARSIKKKDTELMDQRIKKIPTHCTLPAWKRHDFPDIKETVPGILKKETQSEFERKSLTLEYMHHAYPKDQWTHAYTDGSAEEATRNGGGGIQIQLKNGETIQMSIATGKYSSNYKAESEALRIAATELINNTELTHMKVVIFSDALSVLQALKDPKNKDMNELATTLSALSCNTEQTTLQWIPSHCNIPGNEAADKLAKEGGKMVQDEPEVTFEEMKAIVKRTYKRQWLQQHPDYNSKDSYYQLSREDQVMMMRLRTGHCKLKHHMFTKFRVGDTGTCHCGTAPMTVDHFLQHCPTYQEQRKAAWSSNIPLAEKLYGPMENLRKTAAFVRATGVPVRAFDEEERRRRTDTHTSNME